MLTASEKILQKALVGSNLDSRGWNSIQAGLRDRAFFSSQVMEPHLLDAMQKLSAEYARGGTDLSKLRMEWTKYLNHTGYKPDTDVAGTIKDLSSQARIDVIIKTNVAQARSFVQYAEGMTPGAYAAFPAQEFLRVEYRKRKRTDWPKRWRDAGGEIYGGRMIALKNSSVWGNLGKAGPFGTPYPPFDWGSGMGVLDVDRREAIELGLVSKEQIDEHVEKLRQRQSEGTLPSMNGHLVAQIPYKQSVYQDLKSRLGDFVKIDKDKGEIAWREDWTRDFIENEGKTGFSFDAGSATRQLRNVIKRDIDQTHADMLTRGNLRINDSWLNDEEDKHDVEDGHGRKHFGSNETKLETNIPMTSRDLELLPSVWRSPTRAMVSPDVNTTVFLELDTLDGCVMHARIDLSHNPRLKTLFKLKKSYILEEKRKGSTSGGPPTA